MLDKFEVLRNAETYVVNRQFGRAIKEYRSLLESKGEDPALLNTLGDLLLKNKQQPEALEHFRRVAQIFIESGFTNKAIAVCKKIHKLDPSDRNTMGQLADLYVKRGFQSQAAKYYKQLVADSQDAGEFPEAVDWQRQLLKAFPGQPGPFAELAELNLKLEDTEGAQGNLVTASWLSFNKGDYQESVDYAEKALTLDEESEAALRLKEVASRVVVDGESALADPSLQLDPDMFATPTAFQPDEPEAVPAAPAEATIEEPIAEPEPIQVGQDASESAAESDEESSAPKEAVEDYSAVGELGGEAAEDQPASDAEIPGELVAAVEDSGSEPETAMVHELSDDIIDNDLQDVEELFKDAAETKSDSEERPEDFGMVEGEPLGELDIRVGGTVDSLERFGEVLGADEAVEASSEPEEEEASKQLSETQAEYSSENDEIADPSIEISIESEQQLEGVESPAAEEEAEEEATGEPVEEDRTVGLVGADEYFQDQTSVETSEEPDAEQTLSSEVADSQDLTCVDEEEPSISDVVEIPEDIGTLEEPLGELVGDGEAAASPGADQDEEIFELSVEESAEEVLERLEKVPFESEAAGSEDEIAINDLQDDESVLEIADDFSSEGLSSVSVEELFEEAVSADETSELAEDSLEPTLDLDEVEESASGDSDSEVDFQGFESSEENLEADVEVADQRPLDEDSPESILDQELPHELLSDSESEASQPAWADEAELATEPEETLLAEGQSDEGLAHVAEEELEHEKAESEEPHSFWDKLRSTMLGRSPEADEDEGVVESLEQAAELVEVSESTGEEGVEERGDEEELRLETLDAAESEQIEEVESELEAEELVETLSSEESEEELASVEVSESEVEEVGQAVDGEGEPVEVEALDVEVEEPGEAAEEKEWAGEEEIEGEEQVEAAAPEQAEESVESLSDEEVEEEQESLEVSESEVEGAAQAVDEEVEPIEVEALEDSGDSAPEEAGEPEETVELEAVGAAEDRVDEILETEGVEEELESVKVSEDLTDAPAEEEALSTEEPEPEAWEVFWADTDSESDETYRPEEPEEDASESDDLEYQPEAKLETAEAAAAKVAEESPSLWDKLRDTVMGSSNEVDEVDVYTEVSEEGVETVELSEDADETRVDEEELPLEAVELEDAEQAEEIEEVFGAASQEGVVAEPEVGGADGEIDEVLETEGVDEETEEAEIAASKECEDAVSKEEEEPDEQINLAAEERQGAAEAEAWVAEEEIEAEDLVEVAAEEQSEEFGASLSSEEAAEELESVEASESDVEELAEAAEEPAESIELAASEESGEAVPEESREPEAVVEPVEDAKAEPRYEITDLWNRLLKRTLKQDEPEVAVESETVEAGEDETDEILETEGIEEDAEEPELAASEESDNVESTDQIYEELSVEEESEEKRELVAEEDSDDDLKAVAEAAPEAPVQDSPEAESLVEESDTEVPALADSEKEESRVYRATITESWKQPSVYADSSPSLVHEAADSDDSPTSTWHAASDDADNGDGKKDLGSIDEALQEYDFNMKLGLREEAERLISQLLAEHSSDEKVRLRAKSHGISLPSTEKESAPEVEAEGDATLEDEFESAFEDIFKMPGDEIPEDVLVYELDTAETAPSDESKVQFDLGLGYREMGLLDDAIEKFEEAFQVAIDSRDEEHAANCCGMLASTYRELTDYRKVLEWADRGLGLHVAKAFEEKALQYERAQALEMLGDFRQSLDTYRTLMEQDPAFRDVRARVGRLNLLSN